MIPERYQRIKELFLAAPSKNREDRALFLDRACFGDPALRKEVESMLAEDQATGSFFTDSSPDLAPGAGRSEAASTGERGQRAFTPPDRGPVGLPFAPALPTLPEPFSSALQAGRPGEVCDLDATTPEMLYARATARVLVGRDREARADFEAALPALRDACRVELAYLDLRERAPQLAIARLGEVRPRAGEGTALRARVLHILGLARGKLRDIEEATDALVEASSIYRSLGDRARRAQVQDTLGMLHASSGRLEPALSAFLVSLVEKVLVGDRYGIAVTAGNVGRVHLKSGRFQEALDCFELDYQLASEVGDRRGCARVLNDMGRAYLAAEDHARAESQLRACLQVAAEDGYKDIEFFARKDLALAIAAQGRLDQAGGELAAAEKCLAGMSEPYLALLLEAAKGELAAMRSDPGALRLLELAAHKFAEADLPDHEIPLWISLARAYSREKLKRMAEVCLERAAERSRRGGYWRFLRPIREAMAALGASAGLAEETGRLAALEGRESGPDGYVLLENLGRGAFGEVFRAFDPCRDQIVALKRVYVSRVYDQARRQAIHSSLRTELEVASRIRHPGVARVFAIAYDQDENLYVVEEFVKGPRLRDYIVSGRAGELGFVLETARLLAAALDVLHQRGVIHRDLKPENILLRPADESPVLVDFGIACIADFEEGLGSLGVAGTLPYIAPELFRDAPASSKADIYSLGILLYEWLCGRLPWDLADKDRDDVIREKLDGVAWPGELRDRVPPDLVQLVTRLTHQDPERRPDAAEVVRECSRMLEAEAWSACSTDPAGWTSALARLYRECPR